MLIPTAVGIYLMEGVEIHAYFCLRGADGAPRRDDHGPPRTACGGS